MAHGSRLTAHASRLLAQGSLLMAKKKSALGSPGPGPAPNFSWPWALSHEPWGMSHEPWAMSHEPLTIIKFYELMDYAVILIIIGIRYYPRITIPTPASFVNNDWIHASLIDKLMHESTHRFFMLGEVRWHKHIKIEFACIF